MTDNEIMEALGELELYNGFQPKTKILIHNAMYLINRQKAEIERLEQIVEQQDKEILTLQKRIINWRADIDYRPEDIKSEAIKEFADSVKQELRFYYHNQENVRVISIMNHIDNLVKEMTEVSE